jgi:8-amino-3,8-dideoxy-alpha-D-manno-octulosonate transaminase
VKRRNFVAAMAAGSSAKTDPSARAKPIRASFWGPQYYGDEERRELLDVLEKRQPFRWYGPGAEPPKKVLTFEKEFAARMQSKYALAVTSGTAALQVAMAALAIGPGDEVILPAWTWHSCYSAVVLAGALPVFAEIDHSFNLDPTRIEPLITPQTKAILAVHLQGNPADMDPILAIARKHNLKVVEDCAQSVGAIYKRKPVGSLGDIGIYSLQINKTITAGEAGAIVTKNPEYFERAARFHDLGGLREPHKRELGDAHLEAFPGANYRMSEFTGGVVLAQLRKLDRIVADVRRNAQRVYAGVRDLPNIQFRHLPDPDGELGAGVFFRFPDKARCDRFKEAMKAEGVTASNPGGSVVLPTQPYVMKKATLHPAWPTFNTSRGRAIQYGPATCPRTLDILTRCAGPLMDPKFTTADTDAIIAAVRKTYPAVMSA